MVLWFCPTCREEYRVGRPVQRRCCLDAIGRAVPILAVEGSWETDGVSTRLTWTEIEEQTAETPWGV